MANLQTRHGFIKKSSLLNLERFKEIRNERLSSLTDIHCYFMNLISFFFQVDISVVKNSFCFDIELSNLNKFIDGSQRSLFISHNRDESVHESDSTSNFPRRYSIVEPKKISIFDKNIKQSECICFIRRDLSVPLNCDNISKMVFMVTFANMHEGDASLEELEKILEEVYKTPIIGNITTDYFGGDKSEITDQMISSVDLTLTCLKNAKIYINEKFNLNFDESLNDHKIDYSHSVNQQLLNRVENSVLEWITKIKDILNLFQQIRQESDEFGPKDEIFFWMKFYCKFSTIFEFIENPKISGVIQILNSSNSHILTKWKKMYSDISKQISLANNNIQFLHALDKYFNFLYSKNIDKFLTQYEPLMNALVNTQTTSEYYKTNINSILIKVTNQTISSLKDYLLRECDGSIWNYKNKNLLLKLDKCRKIFINYRESFNKVKLQFLVFSPNFSENEIFTKIDSLSRRVEMITQVIQLTQNYAGLTDTKLDGFAGITENLHGVVNSFKRLNSLPLNFRDKQFEVNFSVLKKNILIFDDSFSEAAVNILNKCKSVEQIIQYLTVFSSLNLPNLNIEKAKGKIINVVQNILKYVENVYKSENKNPNLDRLTSSFTDRILWVRNLLNKTENSIQVIILTKEYITLQEYNSIISKHNYLMKILTDYDWYYQQKWLTMVESVSEMDSSTIFYRNPKNKRLYLNFNQQNLEIFKDYNFMTKIYPDLPPFVYNAFKSAEVIHIERFRVKLLVDSYNNCCNKIPKFYRFFGFWNFEIVDKVIEKGITSIFWNSLNLQNYLNEVDYVINQFVKLINDITCINQYRICNNLECILSTLFVNINIKETLTLSEFKIKFKKNLENITNLFRIKYESVGNTMMEFIDNYCDCVIKPLVDVKKNNKKREEVNFEKTMLMVHFHRRTMECLFKSFKQSLEYMKHYIRESGQSTENLQDLEKSPLILIELRLEEGRVVPSSSFQTINSSLIIIVEEIVESLRDIDTWKCFDQINSQYAFESGIDMKDISTCYYYLKNHKEMNKITHEFQNSIYKSTKVLGDYIKAFEDDFINQIIINFEDERNEIRENLLHHELHINMCRIDEIKHKICCIPDIIMSFPFEIENYFLKKQLNEFMDDKSLLLCSKFYKKFRSMAEEFFLFFNSSIKILSLSLNEIADIRSIMARMTLITEKESYIELNIAPIEEAYSVLSKNLMISTHEMEMVEGLRYLWTKLKELEQSTTDRLLEAAPVFQMRLNTNISLLDIECDQFYDSYEKNGPMTKGKTSTEVSDILILVLSNFESIYRRHSIFCGEQELFGVEKSKRPKLEKIKKELSMLEKLFTLYNDVNNYIYHINNIRWKELKPSMILDTVQEFQVRLRRLPSGVRDCDAFVEIKKRIDDLNEILPLIEMMSSKALLKRHWEKISTILCTKLDPKDEEFVIKTLIDLNINMHKETIEDIYVAAEKEKEIDTKLKKIILEWSLKEFEFNKFKSRGELLLKGETTDEITESLEDTLLILNSLATNRYNEPFRGKCEKWQKDLNHVSELLDKWLNLQNLWLYLESVFIGGDIARQLPTESKRFINVDKTWNKLMTRAREIGLVVEFCCFDETLGDMFTHMTEQLEICRKSLCGYLERKRKIFPRFCFVSDACLLEILGKASDSHTIQNNLISVFDNTKTVIFSKKYYDNILGVVSSEGEEVMLKNYVKAEGNVENWLQDLLNMSHLTIKEIINSAYNAISEPNFQLVEFLERFPSQIGLLGLEMIWTRDSSISIYKSKYDKKIMSNTNKYFLELLNELISQTTKDLSKNERTKFETLITIQVHQKDIFDGLCHSNIRSINDFEWTKQTRFYFDTNTKTCSICITDVNFKYQNEYLGCTERLVVTPLTDRCYITIAQAIRLSMGAAPAGPAGTGKTETTKDMGHCIGKYVVVFNCSDQMDYIGLGRIFKGLVMSGTWGCFDEFNRIELSVLSVAAQQISVVLNFKKERKKMLIFTDGDVVNLNYEFGIFLTMNPGYAGRQELPENLKINFRTISMMIPDRQIIIRVKLASIGFINNIDLSRKFFTLYKLCEELLSKQVHYDFGLRNMLSVLRTLGNSKRSNPGKAEEIVVMKGLVDMNLSKLVDADEPLFKSLIAGLFPSLTMEENENIYLNNSIREVITKNKHIYHQPWVNKIFQLNETQMVRHGIITLGESGTGKSSCIEVLMKALSTNGNIYRESSQMFGKLNVSTNDWTDGIFSTLWRKASNIKKGEYIWIILDGPVDSLWIENLNSVLDDNKTLTLANGDRIPMSPNCKLIFEVHNIDNASPATVSRNGIVYFSSLGLGWEPQFQSWLEKKTLTEKKVISDCFNDCFHGIFEYTNKQLNLKIPIYESFILRQACDIFDGLLIRRDTKMYSSWTFKRLCTFSIIWSFGGLLNNEDRNKLNKFIITNYYKSLDLPTFESSIFDYFINEMCEWKHFENVVGDKIVLTTDFNDYNSILVPNLDSVRMNYLIGLIAVQGKGVLLTGDQGTAKTVTINSYLSQYDPESHSVSTVNFSYYTTPQIFQRVIETNVDKRVGTTYGPLSGKKMTLFIDDINMPSINEWGDQVTNELTRQLMETGGFYSLDKPGIFCNIIDIQFICAMISPGGGRNDIPERLKRQFCIFNACLPTDMSIDKIFKTIANTYFTEERKFSKDILASIDKVIVMTRFVWESLKNKMLPSPAKFHYVFNLRDLSRIWQGLTSTTPDVVTNKEKLILLWRHECMRVFADRFINKDECDWFSNLLASTIINEFGDLKLVDDVYFANFINSEYEGNDNIDSELCLPYIPIYDINILKDNLEMQMCSYNETIRGSGLDLVFFDEAIINIIKISRIMRLERGHILLVGIGGSGRKSLTKLASFIAGYKTYQISLSRSYGLSDLMEDLKVLYLAAGLDGRGITFIFSETDIKDETFLEPINNMLSCGTISNLFTPEEVVEINSNLTHIMRKEFPKRLPTPNNLREYFMYRVRKNLHIALCFSPTGDTLRVRSLRFSGLISGCTVVWFYSWPKKALLSVANRYLRDFKELNCSDKTFHDLVSVMGTIHELVVEGSQEYFKKFRRVVHVTPKSYFSFLTLFKETYKDKLWEVTNEKARMSDGIKKLVEASSAIEVLSKELQVMEAELVIASEKAENVLIEVKEKASLAQVVKAQVQKVKDKAQNIVDNIDKDRKIAEERLLEAKPALEEAEAALNTIKPSDIATVKKLPKPPHLIMRIMDCVLILFRMKLNHVIYNSDKKFINLSWTESLKFMSAGSLLQMLQNFPKDIINDEIVELLEPYMRMEDYNITNGRKVCGNVAGLLSWTKAMCYFYEINKEVLPLKENLVLQEARLELANKDLVIAQSQLDEKEYELGVVRQMYDNAVGEKMRLIQEANDCRNKMNTAKILINGLEGEKCRWTQQVKDFEDEIDKLIGDIILCSAYTSYCGPFNHEFRSYLKKIWITQICKNQIPLELSLDIVDKLVLPTTVLDWNIKGLPSDNLSISNGLIVVKSLRYPLLIDPQDQGYKWIKNMEENNNFIKTDFNDKNFRMKLEESLSFGHPLIIENVEEEIDPILDNILERNFVRIGSMYKVMVGDKEVDVMKGFRLYLISKLSNPNFNPQISSKTSIIDMTVTESGLEEQLLKSVIHYEQEDLEKERISLVHEVMNNKLLIKQLEDNLLSRLISIKGSLVEDKTLLQVLQDTKRTEITVNHQLEVSAETQIKISNIEEEYRHVAIRGAILYFTVFEMSQVNCMYAISLNQFMNLFANSITKTPKTILTAKRVQTIIETLTYNVFTHAVRGYLEKDKFTFILLLVMKIGLKSKDIRKEEYLTFLKGGDSLNLRSVEPNEFSWIQDHIWLNLLSLSKLQKFTGIINVIKENEKTWKLWYDHKSPETQPLPSGYSEFLSKFQQLLLIRCFLPERMLSCAKEFVSFTMGDKYVEGNVLNFEEMLKESTSRIPLLGILAIGSDPTESIDILSRKYKRDLSSVSMGQGQQNIAIKKLHSAMLDGNWVLLQNCHLDFEFLEIILQILINQSHYIHDDFRLWITTEYHDKFPINFLHISLKYTSEPPRGIRAGLKRTYNSINEDFFESMASTQWTPLIFTTAFMHSILQERRKFGPLGWNIPYEFNASDFNSSVQFIFNYLDDMDPKKGISWNCIHYMIGEIMYGGRVTDDFDKRLLLSFCTKYFGDHIFRPNYNIDDYQCPKERNKTEILTKINEFSDYDSPQVFGLHNNAEITYFRNAAEYCLSSIVNVMPSDTNVYSSESKESFVLRFCEEILSILPIYGDPSQITKHLQELGTHQPMIIFLRQELERMEKLVNVIKETLDNLILSINGTIVMNDELKQTFNDIYNLRVSKTWIKFSWVTHSLSVWINELVKRGSQYFDWLKNGRPKSFWLPGFFNPQGFLTAVLQESVRDRKGWNLDCAVLHNEVMHFFKDEVTENASEGVYIHGLFLEGAGWDRKRCRLKESKFKIIYEDMPVIRLFAVSSNNAIKESFYVCPIYKNPQRSGINYISSIRLKSLEPIYHWIFRGTALLCSNK